MDNVIVDAVRVVRCAILRAEQPLELRFVLGEEQFRLASLGTLGTGFTKQPARSVSLVLRLNHLGTGRSFQGSRGAQNNRAKGIAAPRPRVAEPDRGQQIKRGGFRTAVMRRDTDQDVLRRSFGGFDEQVEVRVFVEDTRVQEFQFRSFAPAAAILLEKFRIGELRLWVLVEEFHVGVRGRGVQVEVVFLHILAVIAFVAAKPKQTFLQNRIAAIPERQRKANKLMAIRNASDAVFAPAVSARAGMIMREIVPGRAVGAVVLADRAPLALGKIGSPPFPVHLARARLFKPSMLSSHARASLLERLVATEHGRTKSSGPLSLTQLDAKLASRSRRILNRACRRPVTCANGWKAHKVRLGGQPETQAVLPAA